MFKPVSLWLGYKYVLSKKNNAFISFIGILSIISIALGIIVLITVLSVMNGFDKTITDKVFTNIPTMSISSYSGQITNWQQRQKQLQMLAPTSHIEPMIIGQGLIKSGSKSAPAAVYGIHPEGFDAIIPLANQMVAGSLDSLKANQYRVLIGESLAYRMGVGLGDHVLLITPQLNYSPVAMMPRLRQFTISGIFHISGSFSYDDQLVFIEMNDAQQLYQMDSEINFFYIKLREPFQVAQYRHHFQQVLPDDFEIQDWRTQYGSFFNAIKMEKTMMFLILMLIIAVAIFNLVSMLVMVVNEKRQNIAVLRTIGASTGCVMRIFIIQGMIIGVLGTVLGVVLGMLLAAHVTMLVNSIEQWLHIHFISADVYFVNYLPSEIQWQDVLLVSSLSLVLSLLATLYPAFKAANIKPAKVLRYE